MNDSYDVIVIGAGNGGLSAAMTLAKAGKKVLVLEKQHLPGGCATSVVRGRFEFEVSLHELCQMGEEGRVRALLNDYGLAVDWVSIEEAFRSINYSDQPEEAFDITLPVGIDAFIQTIEDLVPGSMPALKNIMEMGKMITDGVRWLAKRQNEPGGLDKMIMLMKYRDLMKLVPEPCDQILRKMGLPDKAREIIESYWDYVCVDSTKMSFAVYIFMLYTYLTQKPWIARYRSHEIALAFDDAIRRAGGEIWYHATVRGITIRENRVKGVTLANGDFIPCAYVMSNLMPHTVFGSMVDPTEVPKRDRQLMNARSLASSTVTITLGLDIPYDQLGFKAYDTFVRHTGDTLAQYESSARIETHQDYCVTILNEAIPDCSPDGTCMIQFSKFYKDDPFGGVSEADYFKVKDQIAEATITHFETIMGINLRDHIEEIMVTTPMTWARYIGTPRGVVYGYPPETWDGMFPRVESGHYLDYTVRGLRFCGGHGTQMDGYSQAFLSGREQALYMLNDMAITQNAK